MLPWTDFGKWKEKGARRIDLDGPYHMMSFYVKCGGDGKRKEAKIQCEYQVGSLCQVTEQLISY